jgi:hypothetical protein
MGLGRGGARAEGRRHLRNATAEGTGWGWWGRGLAARGEGNCKVLDQGRDEVQHRTLNWAGGGASSLNIGYTSRERGLLWLEERLVLSRRGQEMTLIGFCSRNRCRQVVLDNPSHIGQFIENPTWKFIYHLCWCGRWGGSCSWVMSLVSGWRGCCPLTWQFPPYWHGESPFLETTCT